MITWAIAKGNERGMLGHWVADHIWPGANRDFGNCQGMAVIENETVIAGAIWHNYEPDSGVIEVSAAATSKRWLTRQTLGVLFGVPFKEWNCQAVVMRVSDHDEALHRMLKAYGFEKYRIPRLRGRDEAENVFVLTEENWASNKFQKREAKTAA